MKKISLTGIKPTGDLHIGNYFGAIKPALDLTAEYDARYFIADYHALNIMKDPRELAASIRQVAAGWLAAGLDPEKVIFYRQSSIPETFELSTMLMAFTAKGLMNRAHAYKAAVQENNEKGDDPDAGVNMGLFTYPVLMAADIILFDSDVVPVGKDQV
ncbi:MAG: tryptophan--tRNA ligase, partial [Treponema sp.]|nr:tryptophan--tRNA ligase [Treponema sp.]